jgi:hypothetical protein
MDYQTDSVSRPDPWPTTFGYHEFFHACTALAAVCQYRHVVRGFLELVGRKGIRICVSAKSAAKRLPRSGGERYWGPCRAYTALS